MKVIFLILCFLASVANGAPTFVGATGSGSGSSITTKTNTRSPTSSNFLVVTIGSWNGTAAPTANVLTDTRGNTIPTPTIDFTFSHSRTTVFLIPNCIGGAGTFTATPTMSGSGDINISVAEFSGMPSTVTLDGTPASASSATSTVTTGNDTISTAGSLVIGILYVQSGAGTIAQGGTGTFIEAVNDQNLAGGETNEIAYQFAGSTGAYNYSPNASPNLNLLGAVIGVSASGGASCTNYFWSSTGAWAIPNGTTGSYWSTTGVFATPNCSTGSYWLKSGAKGAN